MEKFLFILIFISTFSEAFASDPYEDIPENLAPQKETNRQVPHFKSPQGTWTYAFELIQTDGTIRVLSELNRDVMVKPASTMKLFTSWFAFKKEFRDNTYLAEMLKKSVNAMADATLKGLGGAKNLKAFYTEQGLTLDSTNFIQVDGSGLSYDNKTNCATEMELLKLMHRDPSFNDYKVLLARPGEEGTLDDRLLDLKDSLFAKTGTLAKTASLTGFVETKSGTVLFCILTDYLPKQSRNYRPQIDAMVLKNIQDLNY